MADETLTTESTVYVTYIAAAPERVWAALTSSEFTKQYFFGRTVESDWNVGSEWLLRKPDGTIDVRGVVRESVSPRKLVLTWNMDAAEFRHLPECIVIYEIEPVREHVVRLTMTEAHPTPIAAYLLEGGRHGWPMILSGLKSLLETGKPLAMPVPQPPRRIESMAADRFVYVTYIRTSLEKLWNALLDPEFTRQYWCETVQESEWKKGASWRIMIPDGRVADSGEIIEIEPRQKLVLSWQNQFVPEMKEEGFSRMTYELEPVGQSVKLTVTHEMDKPESKLIQAVSNVWPHILASLKSLLETGAPLMETSKWPEGV